MICSLSTPLARLVRQLLLTAVVLVAVPAVVFAVDGRLEINQTCALAGCFPGDAAGFPVTITTSGSYVLTGSLQTGSLDLSGISIQNSFVTVDLNGFAIRGVYTCGFNPPNCDPGRGAGSGIIGASFAQGVVIRNGTIERFGASQVDLPSLARVEDLLVDFGGSNGVQVGVGSVVRNCLIEAHRGVGIRVFSTAATDGRVEGNFIRSARAGGIEMSGGFATGNQVANSAPVTIFSAATGYGQNRFSSTPNAGTSSGDNICGTSAC